MALTKAKKHEVVLEVKDLLNTSKMTVVTKYQGTTVKDLQDLRRQGRDNGTKVKVVKNRLVKQALSESDKLKDIDTSILDGMLLYAFNAEDEVAPAQIIDSVKDLAALPSKDLLIAQVIATLASPLNEVLSGVSGGLHALLDGVSAQAAN
jgi:large subunit ribosomal protein L10